MSKILSTLRDNIHNTKRIKSASKLFAGPTEIVLLDFIGAPEYFITEYGAIFSRKGLYPNRKGVVTKGYLPLSIIDPYYPVKWTALSIGRGKIWIPINQLLGWAFRPQPDRAQRYFINSRPNIYPAHVDSYEWSDVPPELPAHSKYLQFIDEIYGEDE